jgi:hypothetical protein
MSYLREAGDEILDDGLTLGLRQTGPEGVGLDGHGGSHSFTNANS